MKVVIHQPHFFPYPGFFHKLSLADTYVIMDDVQYDKRWTNRNRIMATNGWTWLTVPINKNHKFLPNMLVEINNEISWKEHHWKKIYQSYAKSKYFHLYKDYLENLYKREWKLLFDLDFETIKKTIDWLGLKIEVVKESELHVNGESTERLVNVCKAIGADTYVAGGGSKNYMEEKLFLKSNLKIEYQNYIPIPYSQRFTDVFVPDLSIIDMLANVGSRSLQMITSTHEDLLVITNK
ncbi:MAG TPA: WbqC family protein [Nitrosopumilaceae archaeon]|nr:WbqC family protein [Nitrosopumilaceae archaeon]